MKRALVPFLLFACNAAAQDLPKFGAFLGYTYVRTGKSSNAPSYGANGAGGQFAYNFSTYLGVVADVGAVHNGNIGGYAVDNTEVNFLAGPRLSMPYSRLRPYFNVMFGGVSMSASSAASAIAGQPVFVPGLPTPVPGQPITVRVVAQQTAFAMTAGGGLDIKISKYVSFRPIALDYYMTRLQNLRTQNDNNQNSLRYTAGINFTFGAR